MKKILFETDDALEQYNAWERDDKKIFYKIMKLLNDTRQNPFEGIGKPEPLKHSLKGC